MSRLPLPLLTSRTELSRWCTEIRASGRPLHFVPTMGALHRGHQELIRPGGSGGGLRSTGRAGECVRQPAAVRTRRGFRSLSAGPDSRCRPWRRRRAPMPCSLLMRRRSIPGGEAALTRIQPPAQLQARSVVASAPVISRVWPPWWPGCWRWCVLIVSCWGRRTGSSW